MTLAEVQAKWSVILIDLLGLYIMNESTSFASWASAFESSRFLRILEKCERHSSSARASPHFSRVLKNTPCIYNSTMQSALHSFNISILSLSSPYNSTSKRCNLCLIKEKFLIICRPELSSLNKRYELVSSCRHRNKASLRNRWTKQLN